MARAILEIHADGSAIRRVFGEIQAESARASSAISGEWRTVGDAMANSLQRARAEVGASLATIRRHERAVTQTQQEESGRRRAIAQAEGGYRGAMLTDQEREAARVEDRITQNHERQGRRRVSFEQQVSQEQERIHRQLVAARERAAAEEARNTEQRRQRLGRGAVAVAGAAWGMATNVHGQIQDARERQASLQEQVMGAVSQVGVYDLGEINSHVSRVRQAAQRHGLSSEAIAEAISQAQTEFSSLSDMERANSTPVQRQEVLDRAISTAVRGRNMGVNPGEFSRLMGMLNAQGLGTRDQEFLSAWTVGAAQRGAVEPGAVTREAMQPIIQRMSAAVSEAGPNATQEQRSRAARDAYMQAFAEIQVLRSGGENVRAGANAMRGFSQSLTNPGRIAKMRTNIEHIQDAALRQRVQREVFDGQGNLNAGLNNPLYLVATLMRAGVTNPQQMANIFAGTGPGNAQAFTEPVRRMMTGLARSDTSGKTGVERVMELRSAQTALSPARLAAMAAMYEGSDRANLTRNQEAHDASLADNTSALNRVSNAIADWTTRNPIAAAGVSAGGGLAANLAGGALAGQAGGLLLRGGGAARAGLAALGRVGPALAAVGGGTTAAVAAASLLGGLAVGEGINRLAYNDRDRAQSSTGGDTSILSGTTWRGFGRGIVDWFRGGGSIETGVGRFDPEAQRRAMGLPTTPAPDPAPPIVAAVDRLTSVIQQGIPTSPHDRSLQDGVAAGAPGRTPPAP